MDYKLLNGVQTYAPASRVDLIEYATEQKRILVAINAEKILKLPEEIKILINKNIGYPDGIGAVWALNSKGVKDVVKIPGCELWLDFINKYSCSKSFYLVGGSQEVIVKTVEKLKNNFPSINIVNFRNGYIQTQEERNSLIQDIKNKKPDFIFVAMGSPKQEQLMLEMQQAHTAVYQGLGGSFDVFTGSVKRAPKWWVDKNLEWAYRLVKQPTRIKRQLVYLEFFLKLKLKKL